MVNKQWLYPAQPGQPRLRHGEEITNGLLQLSVRNTRNPGLVDGTEVEQLDEIARLDGFHDHLRGQTGPRESGDEVDLVLEKSPHRLDDLDLSLDNLLDTSEHLLHQLSQLVTVVLHVEQEPHLGWQQLVELQILDLLEQSNALRHCSLGRKGPQKFFSHGKEGLHSLEKSADHQEDGGAAALQD